MSASCPGHASCILSPISKQFICCNPIMKEEDEDNLNDNENYHESKNLPISCFNIDDIMDLNEEGYPR
jgi:hypothetical protein